MTLFVEIDEAVKNQMITKHVKLLNSKSEWNSNKISRLCVEKSVWKQKKDAEEALKKQAEFNSAAKDFKASKNVPSFNQAIEKLKLKMNSLGAGMGSKWHLTQSVYQATLNLKDGLIISGSRARGKKSDLKQHTELGVHKGTRKEDCTTI